MTPDCPAPLPMDPPAIVAAYRGQADHVDVFRAHLVGDEDRIVQLRTPEHNRVSLLRAGCEVWSTALAATDTFTLIPDVLPGRQLLEIRTRSSRALRYLGGVDGELKDLLTVTDPTSVHFVRGPDGDALLGVVRGPQGGGRGTVDLYRFDGASFVPAAVEPPAAPVTHAVCPANQLVRGRPASLRVPEPPTDEDGTPTDAPWTTDIWRMDLSDEEALEVVLQARAEGGPRATWVYRPEGKDRWCRMGPVMAGADEEEHDVVEYSRVAPRFSAEVGILPDRAVLVATVVASGAGAANWELTSTQILAVLASDVQPVADLTTHDYGGYGGGGGTTNTTWDAPRPAVLAVAVDVVMYDRDSCPPTSGLTLQRFDGTTFVPWLASLPSTERNYAPVTEAGCRFTSYP